MKINNLSRKKNFPPVSLVFAGKLINLLVDGVCLYRITLYPINHTDIQRKVDWKAPRHLTVPEMLIENNLTIPWLLVSWILAWKGYYLATLPFSAFFFLTALRQVHNGSHQSLGTHKRLTWLSLFLNSVLIMASMNAVKYNHIRHHKYCLSEEDYEGKSAGLPYNCHAHRRMPDGLLCCMDRASRHH